LKFTIILKYRKLVINYSIIWFNSKYRVRP
jgi:hypothetical protein